MATSLAQDDLQWIRKNNVAEFIDSMVADVLQAHPKDPIAHIRMWLVSRRSRRPSPNGRPTGGSPRAGTRPGSASHASIMDTLGEIQGEQRPHFDAGVLRRMSVQEPVPIIQNRRMSYPNLAMRSLKLRDQYAATHACFMQELQRAFPGALPEMDMIAKSTKLLESFGFKKGNAIPMISVCRDELTRSLVDDVEELWGPSFSTGSIGGMVFCGKTGMMAGMAHAPQTAEGMEHYIFISAPHISISNLGEVGKCLRPGRGAPSHACGALDAMLKELKDGTLNVTVDTLDMEQSMMKQQLAGLLRYGAIPTLEELTKVAQKLIKSQVESILAALKVTNKNMEFAFISGIQVHGPDNANFFWPTDFYVQKATGREDVDLRSLDMVDATDLLEEAYANDYARVMAMVQDGDMQSVQKWMAGAPIHPTQNRRAPRQGSGRVRQGAF